jgi:hypothetical protein
MRDAHHCRAQAELCLQIAGLLSDQEAAATRKQPPTCAPVQQNLTHAVELQAQPNPPCSIAERDREVPFRRRGRRAAE